MGAKIRCFLFLRLLFLLIVAWKKRPKTNVFNFLLRALFDNKSYTTKEIFAVFFERTAYYTTISQSFICLKYKLCIELNELLERVDFIRNIELLEEYA